MRNEKKGIKASLKSSFSCVDGAAQARACDTRRGAYAPYSLYGRSELRQAHSRGTGSLQGDGGLDIELLATTPALYSTVLVSYEVI